VDAATGKALWTKSAKEFASGKKVSNPGEGGGIDSKEVKISNSNKYLGVGHGGGDVFLAELTTGKVLWSQDLKGQVRGITFSKDDRFMYAGSGDGNAYKLKIEDGSIVWKADIGSWPFANGFKLSADDKLLGSASKVGEVSVIDTESGKQLWQYDQQGNASWLDFSPDGKYLFAGGGGQGAATLYEAKTGKKLWRLNRFSHSGRFSADGKYIIVSDVNVDLYDINGAHIGTVASKDEGGKVPSQGQFSYINKDGTKLAYARRDMEGEGNALLFAVGKISTKEAANSTTAKAGADSAELATKVASKKSGWLPISIGVFVAITAAAVAVAIRKKKQA
jgi:WD40 repeat protein